MKITTKNFKITYKTDWIVFNVNDDSSTRSVRFKAVFSSDKPFNEIEIGRIEALNIIQPGLSVNEWFKKMLHGKRLGTDSAKLETLGENVMLVKNTSPAYLLETFFNILKRLEPKLKSLEYVD